MQADALSRRAQELGAKLPAARQAAADAERRARAANEAFWGAQRAAARVERQLAPLRAEGARMGARVAEIAARGTAIEALTTDAMASVRIRAEIVANVFLSLGRLRLATPEGTRPAQLQGVEPARGETLAELRALRACARHAAKERLRALRQAQAGDAPAEAGGEAAAERRAASVREHLHAAREAAKEARQL